MVIVICHIKEKCKISILRGQIAKGYIIIRTHETHENEEMERQRKINHQRKQLSK